MAADTRLMIQIEYNLKNEPARSDESNYGFLQKNPGPKGNSFLTRISINCSQLFVEHFNVKRQTLQSISVTSIARYYPFRY